MLAAEVVTIPKKGKDPKTPQYRRPISLLSCLGKVYERILLKGLNSQVTANNLVPDVQFGFMPGRSTTHQLLRLTEYITSGLAPLKQPSWALARPTIQRGIRGLSTS